MKRLVDHDQLSVATSSRPPWTTPRPDLDLDEQTVAVFERRWAVIRNGPPSQLVDVTDLGPVWRFLCYLGDRSQVMLHGSNAADIDCFEPRLAVDVNAFGAQLGVYATSDGIWPLFYAVIDRARYHGIMVNSCARYGATGEPGYYFSLDPDRADDRRPPWRHGWLYLLPPDTFSAEPVDPDAGLASTQTLSVDPVVPIARLSVAPEDFPFLAAVHLHDDDQLLGLAAAHPSGFPWIGARTSRRWSTPVSL